MGMIIYIALLFLGGGSTQDPGCDYHQYINVGRTYYALSPNYPNNYTVGVTCRWIATCPAGYNCKAECNEILLPQSPQCSMDVLLISKSGDPQLAGAERFCGAGRVTAVSKNQQLSIGLLTSNITSNPGGRFRCDLTAQPAVSPPPSCRCGYKKTSRIVGGEETDINEFPAMAGVVDVTIYQIKCGGIIVASSYVLTAAHCLANRKVDETAVVVGEHDVNTGDSPVTQVLKVQKFIVHSQYNPDNYDYDVGLVRTLTAIVFSDRVGPICLPFKFYNRSFADDKVTALGWGTLFPGGPTSNVLRKVTLDVINQERCQKKMSNLTPRQLCTYTQGKDACQDDSGGPLLYTDPSSGWMFSVGIISYGRFCASDEPGINTRVTAILDWIVAMTPDVTYCKK